MIVFHMNFCSHKAISFFFFRCCCCFVWIHCVCVGICDFNFIFFLAKFRSDEHKKTQNEKKKRNNNLKKKTNGNFIAWFVKITISVAWCVAAPHTINFCFYWISSIFFYSTLATTHSINFQLIRVQLEFGKIKWYFLCAN